ATGSAYALLAVTPGNGITFQYGYNTSVSGGSYTFPNLWIKLTRSGATITAYSSPDGTTWTQAGTTTIAMTDPVTVGLVVCSQPASLLNPSGSNSARLTPAGSSLPVPWADSDIGNPAVAGS